MKIIEVTFRVYDPDAPAKQKDLQIVHNFSVHEVAQARQGVFESILGLKFKKFWESIVLMGLLE